MVGQDLAGMTVLDAFAGSGLLGFEAWSRGAEVILVERNARALASLRLSVEALGASVDVRRGDVLAQASTLGQFDLVFVDPPYSSPVGPILEALECTVRGQLVLEADTRTEVPTTAGRLALERSRTYGGTAIHLYKSGALS